MKHLHSLALLSALGLGSIASAAGFQNGSFESGPSVGGFSQLNAGNTSIAGWAIGGNSVDYIGSYWNASEGSHSIDMSGGNAGTLSQSFDTVIGQTYVVSFDMAGNMDGGNVIKSLDASAGASLINFTFDTTGHSRSNMGWEGKSFSFVANSTSSTLTFSSNEANAYGAAIDNVNVQAVPEPASMAALGLGALGLLKRRRASK